MIYIENIEIQDQDIDNIEKEILYNKDELYVTELLSEINCPFFKRRKISWIKGIDRNKLDSSLYALLNSHGTISEANKYAYSIDRELSSFYIKGEKAHLVYRVTTENDITAVDLINFVSCNLYLIDMYNEIFEKNISKDDIVMKLNVQSPGPIDLQGPITLIAIIALFSVFLVGGKAKYKKDQEGNVDVEIGSKGLLPQILEFIENKNLKSRFDNLEKELLETKEILKIQDPDVKLTNNEIVVDGEDIES